MKASKTNVFLRACFGVFVVYLALGKLWNWAADQSTWSALEMAASAVLTVLIYGCWTWAFTRISMSFVYGEDPDYQQYRKGGGDPFFDSLPSPLNPTPESERFHTDHQSGDEEPKK